MFSMFMLRVFLNSNVFFSNMVFWIGVLLAEHVLIFSAFYLFQRLAKKTPAWLVVSVTMAVGVLRTWFTVVLGTEAGLQKEVDWAFQLIAGAFFELIIVSIWANVNGAFRDHQLLVRELNEIKNSILGYRENAEEILAEEQEKLLELTRSSLLPQISLIEDTIAGANLGKVSRWEVSQELKSLIQDQVRPLSESLSQSAKFLVSPVKKPPSHARWVFIIPKTFGLTNSIFPVINSLTMLLGFVAAPQWILDESWVPTSAMLSITYFLTLVGLKKLTANWPHVKGWVGVPLLVLFAILPVLPAYIATAVFYGNSHQALVYGLSMMVLSLVVFLALALLDSLDYGSRAYRSLLDEENRALSLEMALFEQQIWAARKSWSLVVHGTVQAALTAALTRLNAPDAEAATLKLAKKDLDRAITALTKPPAVVIQFVPALKELIDTWNGVCDIELSITPGLKKTIAKDSRLSMCVNEILKEAISNAVRHGDARNANISLTETESGVLRVLVMNDGSSPKSSKRKGLGSSMFDELTLDWQLTNDENGYQTVLLAHLPFSKSQA